MYYTLHHKDFFFHLVVSIAFEPIASFKEVHALSSNTATLNSEPPNMMVSRFS